MRGLFSLASLSSSFLLKVIFKKKVYEAGVFRELQFLQRLTFSYRPVAQISPILMSSQLRWTIKTLH